MGVNSLPETVTRQRRGCDLNPGPSAPESSTLTTRLPSHPASWSKSGNCSVGGLDRSLAPAEIRDVVGHGDTDSDVFGAKRLYGGGGGARAETPLPNTISASKRD